MILPIWSYSQNTLTITSEQLKTTNLIFSEHKKLLETIPLLELQIDNLEFINSDLMEKDSINKVQLNTAKCIIDEQAKKICTLDDKVKRKQKIINWGSVGTIVLIILCLL